ncbi:MAG TPA: zinc-binding alcohol dehydrogenase family protein [Flavisolibacter sp.]|nr:zinc-binding alcohol dehydrogenase family protein [Flavisolibacter sp.]
MKALICTAPGQFDYAQIEMPLLKKGETLLKIERIGICGTDLHAFEGTQPFFTYPRVLGHELAATVVKTDAEDLSNGEAVTLLPYFNCGTCIACRMNKPNCCVNLKVFGVHIDGGMKEYVVVPSAAVVHGEGLSLDELALVEPLAVGAHAIRRAAVMPGEFVLVVGAGPIGLGTIEMAGIAGATVIVMDINEDRLRFCTRKSAGLHTVNPAKEDALQKLKEITNDDMPTVVIDASGSLKAINNAFQYIAHGGRYVLIGLQKGDIAFSHPEFHKREATLMSSRNATRADFKQVISCIKNGWVNPATYITHRVGFDEIKSNFNSWLVPQAGVIKAMVEV